MVVYAVVIYMLWSYMVVYGQGRGHTGQSQLLNCCGYGCDKESERQRERASQVLLHFSASSHPR
jgi:hypothetical protein